LFTTLSFWELRRIKTRPLGLILTLLLIGTIPGLWGGLISVAEASTELTVHFVEIGCNDVISPDYPSIILTVEDFIGNFLSGVTITITNPEQCPYYEWDVSEEANTYRIKIANFANFAIKDNFQFSFTRAGYTSKIVDQELAINSPYIQITDETGTPRINPSTHFDMNAIPSHIMVFNHLETVFVNSAKHYITWGYDSTTDMTHGSGYIVLDETYNLVINTQTQEKAIIAKLIGPYFSHFPSQTLTELADTANELARLTTLGWYITEVRDTASELLGAVVGSYLGSFSGKMTVPQQMVIDNFKEMRTFFEQTMKQAFPKLIKWGVKLSKDALIAEAIANVHFVGEDFLNLKNTVDAYRGNTHYEFNDINFMFESWVNASARLLAYSDMIQETLGKGGWEQAIPILENFVEGATGFPVDMLLGWNEIQAILENNLQRLTQLRQDFWGWIWDINANSTLLMSKIQSTGYTKVLITKPAMAGLSISAYFETNQMTSITINPGSSIDITVQVDANGDDIPYVDLTVSGHDETITATFSSSTSTPPFTSTLTITTSTSTSGTFILTITGTYGSISQSCEVTLDMKTPSSPGDPVTIDPLNSPVIYGSWIQYHGNADASYNGQHLWMSQSFDGGANWYAVSTSLGYDVPISNGEWSVPWDSTSVGTQVYLPSSLGLSLPVDIMMRARINNQAPVSNVISFQLVKAPTSTSLSVTPKVLPLGQSSNINGILFSSYGISGSEFACQGTWYIDYRKDEGSWITLNSGSVYAEYEWLGLNNPYCIQFLIPTQEFTPTSTGTYDFRMRYSGDMNYEGSTSQIQQILVQSNEYPVTVNVIGLPPENHTNIYIDSIPIDTLAGGESRTYNLNQDTIHTISIDPIISYGTDSRFTSQQTTQIISAPGSVSFEYEKEHLLTIETSPNYGGNVQTSGTTWVTENTVTQAQATPYPLFSFGEWEIDGSPAGSSPYLEINMNMPHTISASFEALPTSANLDLDVGWNMVSFPVIPEDPSFASIFSEVDYYQVLTWTGTSYVTSENAEAGQGYWVLVLSPTAIFLEGTPVDCCELNLPAGWSMIGSVYDENVPNESVFSDYHQLLTWTGTNYASMSTIDPKKGYWALVLSPTSSTLGTRQVQVNLHGSPFNPAGAASWNSNNFDLTSSGVEIDTTTENHTISATPPSGYLFDWWICTGPLSLSDSFAQSTYINVNGSGGFLTALFKNQPTFTLTTSDNAPLIDLPGSATIAMTAESQNGFNGQVDLSIDWEDMPNWVLATEFNSNPVTLTSGIIVFPSLTIEVSDEAVTGIYYPTIVATSGSITKTIPLSLTIVNYPDLILDGTTTSLSGSHNYKNIVLKNGAILQIDNWLNLTVSHDFNVSLDSRIDGVARGINYGGAGGVCSSGAMTVEGSNGQGPGYGRANFGTAGGGGGGAAYGGIGARGGNGNDNSQTALVGTLEYLSIDEGSGGAGGGALTAGHPGSGNIAYGGGGGRSGATIIIEADNINVFGIIDVSGGSGGDGGAQYWYTIGWGSGGGGGSGGGILLKGDRVVLTGASLSSNGGAGGNGAGSPNFDGGSGGGGGSGGRIKIFYTEQLIKPSSASVNGGAGGTGPDANGQNGDQGTVYYENSDGSGNNLEIDGITVTRWGILEYDKVVIKNGGSLIVESFDGVDKGWIKIIANQIIIDSSSQINANGKGYRGGTGILYPPEGNMGGTGEGPGGGGGGNGVLLPGAGGGGAGYGGLGGEGGQLAISGGIGGSYYGSASLTEALLGSGGGGGVGHLIDGWVNPGGNGGNGGGSITLEASIIEVFGTITANGDSATMYVHVQSVGGGGGGSGGSIGLYADYLNVIGSTITANGGNGGLAMAGTTRYAAGSGGGGGGGRIKLFYGPILKTADATISVAGGLRGDGYGGGIHYLGSNGSEGTISYEQNSMLPTIKLSSFPSNLGGSINWDGEIYSPSTDGIDLITLATTHTATATPSYMWFFDHWTFTGPLIVSDVNSPITNVQVQGTGGSLTAVFRPDVTFTITANETSPTIVIPPIPVHLDSKRIELALTSYNGFVGTVDLSWEWPDKPDWAAVSSFSINPISLEDAQTVSTEFTITIPSDAIAGTYYPNIVATCGSIVKTILLVLTVENPPDLIVDATTVILSGNLRFGNVTIINGGTLLVDAYNGTAMGWLNITANTIKVDATSQIIADGKGYRGGIGIFYGEAPSGGLGEGYGGGSGGQNSGGAAGGGAGYGGAGGDGGGGGASGGPTYGSDIDKIVQIGSGGGGGCSYQLVAYMRGGNGGNGGGSIVLNASTLEIFGTISANGNGGGGSLDGNEIGGGGGGSGGSIVLYSNYLNITGAHITAKGGGGGPGSAGSNLFAGTGTGGGGGGGRIVICYCSDFDNRPVIISAAKGLKGPHYTNPEWISFGQDGQDGTVYYEQLLGF
jgi:hypothetical protein